MRWTNNTGKFVKYQGKLVRPWRSIEVEGKEESKQPEKVDISKMTKDELLDYTAIHGIDTDYSMTKSEIKQIIKEQMEGD